MKELIGIAVMIAGIFGGTMAAEKIYDKIRVAALAKSASGLPRLSPFARAMTRPKSGSTQISKKTTKLADAVTQ